LGPCSGQRKGSSGGGGRLSKGDFWSLPQGVSGVGLGVVFAKREES